MIMARDFVHGSSQHSYYQQAEDFKSSRQTSPLGLTLSKTPSFLNLVQMVVSQERNNHETDHVSTLARNEANISSCPYQSHYIHEKLKASNFPALLLRIGSFERISRYEEELIAKCYYAKKKIVWEVLDGPMKSKMEIQWSDIGAIRANIDGSEQGILEIELNQPPLFFKETNPQPRKHTLWQPTSDFTGGQALKCRRHIVHFPPGSLEKHYEKLLQCDRRLLQLSRKPFPSGGSPYFQPNFYHGAISFGRQEDNMPTSLVHPYYHNLQGDPHYQVSHPGQRVEAFNVTMLNNQGEENWTSNDNIYANKEDIEGLPPSIASKSQEEIDPRDNLHVFPSNAHFSMHIGDQSMCSFLDSTNGVNNMGINYLENMQNIVNDGRILGSDEIFEYSSRMTNSLITSQATENNLVMDYYCYEYGLSILESGIL